MLNQGHNFSVFEKEPNMTGVVLLKSYRPFEGSAIIRSKAISYFKN